VGENWLLPCGHESKAQRLLDKCTVRVSAGDVVRMRTPGGGGWGPPAVDAVRPMSVDDVPHVQAVERAAGGLFRSFPEPRVAACADHDPMPADALHAVIAGGGAWVATVGGRVVGFLVAEEFDGGAHIDEVAVDPAFGRRGLATLLLDEAASWAVDRGLQRATLTTFRDVPWNRSFYERRGYRVVAPDEQSAAMRAKVRHEDEADGLPAELRVVMWRDVARVL
jgi:GNAT superfamily N-acetyltransferase